MHVRSRRILSEAHQRRVRDDLTQLTRISLYPLRRRLPEVVRASQVPTGPTSLSFIIRVRPQTSRCVRDLPVPMRRVSLRGVSDRAGSQCTL